VVGRGLPFAGVEWPRVGIQARGLLGTGGVAEYERESAVAATSIPSIGCPLETEVFERCKLKGSETYYRFWVSSSVGDSLRVRQRGGSSQSYKSL
jgi:hypothetical protein